MRYNYYGDIMNNIIDYLLWRGDILVKNNFNQVDSLILARFSYLDLNGIDNNTIESIYNKMKNYKIDKFRSSMDKDLIKELGNSRRFKDMLVTDYVRIDDKNTEKQFCAVTIHLSIKEMYISFMGTDNSINGWKDDFNMSFMDNVSCQVEAKSYLNDIANKYKDKKIIIGGHSKGGNIAIYSAITSSNKIKDRIIKIYNFDGPGFSKNIINKYRDKKIISKIVSYIPESSIIGRMLNHVEKILIVKSYKKGIMAHNVYSWNIIRDDFIYSDKNTIISEDIDYTLTEWLENTSDKERKIFVNTVFEILNSSEVDTFKDIIKNFLRVYLKY